MQRSLPNPKYEEFSYLCSVLNCKSIFNPAWVTLDTERRNLAKLQMKSRLAKLQVSRKEVEGES